MRIVHVIPEFDPSFGGPVTALMGMSAAQRQAGHEVEIVTTGAEDGRQSLNGVTVHCFRTGGAWRWSRSLSTGLAACLEQADIVHIHMVWEYTSLVAARTCRRMGIPFVLRPCGLLDGWALDQKSLKKSVYLKLFRSCLIDGAAALHYTTPLEYERSVFGGLTDRSFVIPIGVPGDVPRSDDSRSDLLTRFPGLAGRRIVLFLGRLHPKKNPDMAIEAFAGVAGRHPDAHLVLAGPGEQDYLDELARLVRGHSLDDKVTFTGMLDRGAVAWAYARADVFLLPSNLENFGISVAEAMKYGCPVIVSDQVYLAPDIIEAGAGLVCGLDAGEFSAALDQVLSDPDARGSFGRNGRLLAGEKYDWNTIVRQLDAVYGDILLNRRTSHVWA